MLASQLIWPLMASLACSSSQTFLKIDNLDALSAEMHSRIFSSHTATQHGFTHDVHVQDLFGKFLKLKYDATHPADAEILKLDNIKADIDSVICDNDAANTIEMQFIDDAAADALYQSMSEALSSSPPREYFIAGSHKWMCRDKHSKRYEPLIRRVTSVLLESDSATLILSTEYAGYTDLFESLDLEFVTNAKLSHSAKSIATKSSSRRRLSWWSEIWTDITASVEDVVDHVETWAEDIAEDFDDLFEDVETVVEVVEGKNVVRNLSDTYTWSYNYDADSDSASSVFYLDSDKFVECKDCYVYFDLTYTFKIRIDDRSLEYMYLVAEGDAKIFAEIELRQKFTKEFDVDTPKVPIPYLSIGVGDIEFGFSVYGALGFGVAMEIDYVGLQYTATGSIKRGIEYDAASNTQNYIGEHDFSYDKQGPSLKFDSANITFYVKPTLHLALSYVGDVYFGVQPEIEFSFTKDADYGSDNAAACAIDYVPTAKLLVFAGAKLKPLDIKTVWDKKASIEVAHSVLTSLEGCITQSTITTIEKYVGDSSRRRLAEVEYTDSSAYIDYTNASTTKRVRDRFYGWGSQSSRWWGNMTRLPSVCRASQDVTLGDANLPVTRPQHGQLLLKVEDSQGGQSLTGVYKTYTEIYASDGWAMTTNVTCVSRMALSRTETWMDFTNIDNYNVTLLEWYCDVNMTSLGITEGSEMEQSWLEMIVLPDTMNALVLDASFGNLMLFDDDWCQVFVVSKQRKYHIDLQELLAIDFTQGQWPSRQWFGSAHCTYDNRVSISMYVDTFHWQNGTGAVWLSGGDSEPIYMTGQVNYTDFSMTLQSTDGLLTFVGVITLMQDGAVLYAGNVDAENCTGFVFQGWVDTSPLESAAYVDDNDEDDNELNTVSPDEDGGDGKTSDADDVNALVIGVCIGVGACAVLVIVTSITMGCFGYSLNKKPKVSSTYELMGNDGL